MGISFLGMPSGRFGGTGSNFSSIVVVFQRGLGMLGRVLCTLSRHSACEPDIYMLTGFGGISELFPAGGHDGVTMRA